MVFSFVNSLLVFNDACEKKACRLSDFALARARKCFVEAILKGEDTQLKAKRDPPIAECLFAVRSRKSFINGKLDLVEYRRIVEMLVNEGRQEPVRTLVELQKFLGVLELVIEVAGEISEGEYSRVAQTNDELCRAQVGVDADLETVVELRVAKRTWAFDRFEDDVHCLLRIRKDSR